MIQLIQLKIKGGIAMKLYNAKEQFQENLRLFANPQTEPEKFNLYAGLTNLAEGLSNIELKLDKLLLLMSQKNY